MFKTVVKGSPLVLAALAAGSLLSGCVVQAPAYAPPPRAYVEPPPPPPPVVQYQAGGAVVTAYEPPPPLPVYAQPPIPEEGYLWTPGYWAWGPGGYYWVPGTWVQPPQYGVLWTPGYWAFAGGVYAFHAGYWGPHVGFYGGVNYGYGYGGAGYAGGRWQGDHFAYNSAVNNVNVTVVHNTYNQTVVNNTVNVSHTSYNGGPSGIAATPTPQEKMFEQEPHVAPTSVQVQHVQQAAANPALQAHANGGSPAIAATPRPGAFTAAGVVAARGAAATAQRESGVQNTYHPQVGNQPASPRPPAAVQAPAGQTGQYHAPAGGQAGQQGQYHAPAAGQATEYHAAGAAPVPARPNVPGQVNGGRVPQAGAQRPESKEKKSPEKP